MRLWSPHSKVTSAEVSCCKGRGWWLKGRSEFSFPFGQCDTLMDMVSIFINVVQSPWLLEEKVQLIKHKTASSSHEYTADRWYHWEWVTWKCVCSSFVISSQFHCRVSQSSLENSSQPSLFWQWRSLMSHSSRVIVLPLWRPSTWLPFFRSASQMSSFTVKSQREKKKKKSKKTSVPSRERPLLTSLLLPPVLSPHFLTVWHWERPVIDYES